MKKETIDQVCGLCAGLAGYAITALALEKVKDSCGILTRSGCVLVQAYVGLEIGGRVRKKVSKIREKLMEEM